MAIVHLRRDGKEMKRIPLLDNTITIGRIQKNHICLESPMISKEHATIHRGAGGLYAVQDNFSTNGTYLNGHRLDQLVSKENRLKPGDVIRLAPFDLQFLPEPHVALYLDGCLGVDDTVGLHAAVALGVDKIGLGLTDEGRVCWKNRREAVSIRVRKDGQLCLIRRQKGLEVSVDNHGYLWQLPDDDIGMSLNDANRIVIGELEVAVYIFDTTSVEAPPQPYVDENNDDSDYTIAFGQRPRPQFPGRFPLTG